MCFGRVDFDDTDPNLKYNIIGNPVTRVRWREVWPAGTRGIPGKPCSAVCWSAEVCLEEKKKIRWWTWHAGSASVKPLWTWNNVRKVFNLSPTITVVPAVPAASHPSTCSFWRTAWWNQAGRKRTACCFRRTIFVRHR